MIAVGKKTTKGEARKILKCGYMKTMAEGVPRWDFHCQMWEQNKIGQKNQWRY